VRLQERKFKNIVRGLLLVSFLSLLVYLLTFLEYIPRLDGGLPIEIAKFNDNQTSFDFDSLSLFQLYVVLGLTIVWIAMIYILSWLMRREGIYLALLIYTFSFVGGLGYVNIETNYTLFLSEISDITFTIAAVMIYLKHKIIS